LPSDERLSRVGRGPREIGLTVATPLKVSQRQVVAFRRRTNGLDERLPMSRRSLRAAAWAGLQDSMPRAALLSIHARVRKTTPTSWEDPSLVQIWGPRYGVFVVAERDLPLFTLGVLPDDAKGRQKAIETAERLHVFLAGERMSYGDAGHGMGVNPNSLRYGAPSGRILIRWEGARAPTVWTVPAPTIDPAAARLELARRYLHIYGPTSPESFARWANLAPRKGVAAFEALGTNVVAVRTPTGEGWILERDEPELRADPGPVAHARLLPSGDAFYLLHGSDRALLVPDARRRAALWTSRVWPGALLADGEVVGTWRRANEFVSVEPWRRLTRAQREGVEEEAATLPLPGLRRPIVVRWDG